MKLGNRDNPLTDRQGNWTERTDWPDLVLAAGFMSLVLALSLVFGVPAYRNLQKQSRDAAIKGNAATLHLAAETYAAGHRGRYPTDVQELFRYLPGNAAPRNPLTGQEVRFLGEAGGLTYRSPSGGTDYVIEAWNTGPDGGLRSVLTLKGESASGSMRWTRKTP